MNLLINTTERELTAAASAANVQVEDTELAWGGCTVKVSKSDQSQLTDELDARGIEWRALS